MSKKFRQSEIYWINLDPSVGAETKKKRSCVVLQADILNENSKTIIVAPFLPEHKNWPFAVNIKPSQKNGLDKDRHINIKQLRSVDISRIGSKQGQLEPQYTQQIKNALNLIFSLDDLS